SHKLKEVIALASRVTVFRAGRVTGERELSGATVGELASMMVGREVSFEDKSVRSPPRSELALELRAAKPVKALARLEPVSFRLHAGEILGVAGVEGNGQTELIRLLLDPRGKLAGGKIFLNGRDVSRASAGSLRAGAGLAVFPEDRLREALLLGDTAEDNFLLGHQRAKRYRRAVLLLNRAALRRETERAIRDFDVRPPNPLATAGSLSGGNQQKLVVAREISVRPKFLLAAQPTRGVDIGAIESIHGRILGLRAEGSGVLLISSELDEVLKLSDRLLVLYRGKVVGSFLRSDFDEKQIGLLMAGGHA
ncbi:MAG: ATP-binding cassette domain-containing protein, partial [Bdellovibrionota bacterium]